MLSVKGCSLASFSYFNREQDERFMCVGEDMCYRAVNEPDCMPVKRLMRRNTRKSSQSNSGSPWVILDINVNVQSLLEDGLSVL